MCRGGDRKGRIGVILSIWEDGGTIPEMGSTGE